MSFSDVFNIISSRLTHVVTMASFVFYGGVHSILIGELSLFTFKVAIDGYIRTVILLIVLGCFRSSFCSFYLLLLSSLAM